MQQSSSLRPDGIRSVASQYHSNGVPKIRNLPLFPHPQELVFNENNVGLLDALLQALKKHKCFELSKGKRSPFHGAYCELHHSKLGAWGCDKFLDAPHLDSIHHRNEFEYKVLEEIFKALRQYQGNSTVHRELLERLENFKEKYDRCHAAEQEAKMAAKKALDEQVARVEAETEVARLEDEYTRAADKASMLIAEKEAAETLVERLEDEKRKANEELTEYKNRLIERNFAVARLEDFEKRASIQVESADARLAECRNQLNKERKALKEAAEENSRLRAELKAAASEKAAAMAGLEKSANTSYQFVASELAGCKKDLKKQQAASIRAASAAAGDIARLKADLTAARSEADEKIAAAENRAQSAVAELAKCKIQLEESKKDQEALTEAAKLRTKENDRLKAELEDSEKRASNEAQSAAAGLAECRNQFKKEQEATKEATRAVTEKISQLEAELATARSEAVEKKATAEVAVARLQASEKSASNEANSAAARLADCENQLKTEKEASAKAAQLATDEKSRLTADLAAARLEVDENKASVDDAVARMKETTAELSECKNQLEHFKKKVEAATESTQLAAQENSRLKADLEAARNEALDMVALLEASEKRAFNEAQTAATKLSKCENQLKQLRKEQGASTEKISRLEADLKAARSEAAEKNAALQDVIARLEESQKSSTNQLEQLKKEQDASAKSQSAADENSRLMADSKAARPEADKKNAAVQDFVALLEKCEKKVSKDAQSAAAKLVQSKNQREQLEKENQACAEAAQSAEEENFRLKVESKAAGCEGVVMKKAALDDVAARHLAGGKKGATPKRAQLSTSSKQEQNQNDSRNRRRSRPKASNELSPVRQSKRSKRKAESMFEDARKEFDKSSANELEQLKKKQDASAKSPQPTADENSRLIADSKDARSKADKKKASVQDVVARPEECKTRVSKDARTAAAKLACCKNQWEQLKKEKEGCAEAAQSVDEENCRLKVELKAACCEGVVEKNATVDDVATRDLAGGKKRATLKKARLSTSSKQKQNQNDIRNRRRSRPKARNELSPVRQSKRSKRKAESMFEDAREEYERTEAAKRAKLSKTNNGE